MSSQQQSRDQGNREMNTISYHNIQCKHTHNVQYMCSERVYCSNTPTHSLSEHLSSPITSLGFMNWFLGSPFVSRSAIISVVGQYFKSIVPFVTWSLTKWYLIPMCFERPWNCRLCDIAMVDWLSSKITVGSVGGLADNSAQSCLIHTASCVVAVRAANNYARAS